MDDSFSYLQAGRFDIEQELMLPMQKMHLKDSKDIGKLFAPLYRPSFPHLFGLDFFYGRQNAIRESSRDDSIDITSENTAENVADIRNKRYVAIIMELLSYAENKSVFCFSEYLGSVPKEQLHEQLKEKSLPDVMLKLYGFGEIDIASWRLSQQDVVVPVGEFDLSYCLSNLPEELVKMDSIVIHRLDEVITLSDDAGGIIRMNDFNIEVRR